MNRTPLYLAIAGLTLSAGVTPAFGQDQALEEITVTGSFIKRKDSFDTATPVDVVDQIDIARSGTPNVGDIVRNQTFNYGVDAVSNIIGTTGQGGVNTSSNLRGLGEGATLILMDGRRSATGNVKTLYPQIMLQRVETLTDGAAALYGTDAVGGVQNFIPMKSFEGFDVEFGYGTDTGDGDYDESTVSFITGASGDNSSFVFAASYRDRSILKFTDRPEYSEGGLSASGDGNPGSYFVPNRDVNGNLIPAPVNPGDPADVTKQRDPFCQLLGGQGPDGKSSVGAQPTGFVFGADTCRLEFGANFDYIAPEKVFNMGAVFNHDFSDTLSFESEFTFSRQDAVNRGSPSNPGGRTGDLGPIPGEHPNNPYRAVDANGNPLFALDADADGVPDRDANGVVLLSATPLAAGANSIAFNEDVTIAGWRPVGYQKVAGLPAPSHLNSDGSADGAGTFVTDQHRFVAQLNYEMGDTWTGWTDYVYHRVETVLPVLVQSLSAIKSGINCDLAVGGTTECFNPFGSQFNGQGVNSQGVWDQISYLEDTTTNNTIQTIDSIATGDLFEMPAGVAQAAVGAQWRYTEFDSDVGSTENAGDAYVQGSNLDYNAERDVYALFGEIELPLMDSDTLGVLELNAAVRSEWTNDDSDADLDSTDYKLAFRWQVADMASIRASWGTAFISPTLQELFAPATTGLSNVTDPLVGAGAAFKSRRLGGNPNLVAQEADVYNLGFTLNFLDGDLSWTFDYKVFEFTDRIARPLPQDVLTQDFIAYQAALAAGDVANTTEWINGTGANPNAQEDPQIIRDGANNLLLVDADLINAQEMTWKGFDTSINYNIDTDSLGLFTVALSGTYADEYSFTAATGGTEVNGAGKRNNRTGFVPPVPRVRANLRFGWDYDIHSVSLTGNYTHHLIQDGSTCDPLLDRNGNPAVSEFIGNALGGTTDCDLGDRIPAYTVWDLQYRADIDGLFGDTATTITVGALNMFNNEAPADRSLGGLETFLYDPRGAQWYVRLRQSF